MANIAFNRALKVVVSDMTAFWCNNVYYELTLFLDLFNKEIVLHDISTIKGDRSTYINGLDNIIEKKEHKDLKMILHSNQGSLYSSKTLISSYLCIISHIQCLVQVLLQIILQWN